MKKFFGILGSAVLCVTVGMACLAGCGDATSEQPVVVCEWNMGVDDGAVFLDVPPDCNLEKVDEAEAKDGKAIEVTVTSAGYASILVTDLKTPMKATEAKLKIYSAGEASVWLELTEYDPWEHLFEKDDMGIDRKGGELELKEGWNEYTITLKRGIQGRLNTFCFKTSSIEAVTFKLDTVVWYKPAE